MAHYSKTYTSPAQFKFTRGSWEREAILSNADTGNLIIHDAEHANLSVKIL